MTSENMSILTPTPTPTLTLTLTPTLTLPRCASMGMTLENMSISEFIRRPYLQTDSNTALIARNNYSNPVQMWNDKTRSFLRVERPKVILRQEELFDIEALQRKLPPLAEHGFTMASSRVSLTPLYLPNLSPVSPLYLAYISPISPPYLPPGELPAAQRGKVHPGRGGQLAARVQVHAEGPGLREVKSHRAGERIQRG
jgi:hypothetical protein